MFLLDTSYTILYDPITIVLETFKQAFEAVNVSQLPFITLIPW